MPQIAVTHAPSGLVHASVVRAERVTPHMVRVTLGGEDLRRFEYRGFDSVGPAGDPGGDDTWFDNMSDRFDTRAYLRFLTLPKATRPVIRAYTIRDHRPDGPRDARGRHRLRLPRPRRRRRPLGRGRAARRRRRVHRPGLRVGARPRRPRPARRRRERPAVAGILRDLRDTVGDAFVGSSSTPPMPSPSTLPWDGATAHWLPRAGSEPVGEPALAALRALPWSDGTVAAFAVGESGSRPAPGGSSSTSAAPQDPRHLLRLLEGRHARPVLIPAARRPRPPGPVHLTGTRSGSAVPRPARCYRRANAVEADISSRRSSRASPLLALWLGLPRCTRCSRAGVPAGVVGSSHRPRPGSPGAVRCPGAVARGRRRRAGRRGGRARALRCRRRAHRLRPRVLAVWFAAAAGGVVAVLTSSVMILSPVLRHEGLVPTLRVAMLDLVRGRRRLGATYGWVVGVRDGRACTAAGAGDR